MGQSSRDRYIKHGSVLAITSFLVRIIGMLYRIPMTAIIGDRGNGLYSAAFEIYNIILLISTYTLPMAMSRLISPKMAARDFRGAYRYYRLALVFALVVGGMFSALSFFGADMLSGVWLKSPMSAIALRVLAPTILTVSIMGVFRGFFQSTGSMIQTSVSQIIEQLVNAFVSVLAAYLLFIYGSKLSAVGGSSDLPYAYGAAGGTMGTLSGALIALLYLVIAILVFNSGIKKMARRQNGYAYDAESYKDMLKALLMTIIPIIISTAVYNLNTILNQGMYYHTAAAKGIPAAEYESMWGIFSGKYRILSNVPIAVASSMATSVIPGLSVAANDAEDFRQINYRLRNTVKMVMLFIIPCVVGFTVLGHPIIDLLFNGSEQSQTVAGNMLSYGSIIVLFTALSTLSTGFMQGLGHVKAPVISTLLALIIQLGVFKLLLEFTSLGIYSMPVANLVFVFIIFAVNSVMLKIYTGYRQEIGRSFILPSIAAFLMGAVTFGSYKLFMLISANRNGISAIISIILSMAVYFILIIKLRAVSKKEMAQLPKGIAMVRLGERLRLW